jgi:hypothetical protein
MTSQKLPSAKNTSRKVYVRNYQSAICIMSQHLIASLPVLTFCAANVRTTNVVILMLILTHMPRSATVLQPLDIVNKAQPVRIAMSTSVQSMRPRGNATQRIVDCHILIVRASFASATRRPKLPKQALLLTRVLY